MKNCKIIALALSVLALASCAQKACIKGVITDGPDRQLLVKQLVAGNFSVLDTLQTRQDGSFSCKVDVEKGQPAFIYLYSGDTKLASLLLECGETAVVTADTLGKYSVDGSEGSIKLKEVDDRFRAFAEAMATTDDTAELGKLYVNHYRESVKYIMDNPFSLTVIPVLYEQLNNLPIFSQVTDALFFRSACDSLKTVYPDSKYVKALEKETVRREQELTLSSRLDGAVEAGFPDLNLPDQNGEKRALSGVDSKVILLHFWDAEDATHKMLNLETLIPIYEKYHSRGLEIYSVCVTMDKALWASVVKSQNLSWINVNDGLGAASPAVALYNIGAVPAAFLIADGDLLPDAVAGENGLRRELERLLK